MSKCGALSLRFKVSPTIQESPRHCGGSATFFSRSTLVQPNRHENNQGSADNGDQHSGGASRTVTAPPAPPSLGYIHVARLGPGVQQWNILELEPGFAAQARLSIHDKHPVEYAPQQGHLPAVQVRDRSGDVAHAAHKGKM